MHLDARLAPVADVRGSAQLLSGESYSFPAPVTYTGFTITDGQLGHWKFQRKFQNARVYLTFKGDTKDVQFVQVPVAPTDPTLGSVDAYIQQTGVASVTIFSGGKSVHATFAPNQILITSDLGATGDTRERDRE